MHILLLILLHFYLSSIYNGGLLLEIEHFLCLTSTFTSVKDKCIAMQVKKKHIQICIDLYFSRIYN